MINAHNQYDFPDAVATLAWRRCPEGWRIESVSGAIAAIAGQGPGALVGDGAAWRAAGGVDPVAEVERSAADADEITLRHALTRPDGSIRRVVEQIAITRGADGIPQAFDAVVMDVTDVAGRDVGIGLLAYVSHEVRTPLTGILGVAETLSRSNLTAEQAEMVRTLSDAGTALMALVNNVLELSRIEQGEAALTESDFRLGALCRSVAALYACALPAGGPTLTVEGQHMDILLRGDANKLRQALSNLVMNATKFTREGAIVVRWRTEPRDGALVAQIDVEDTGVGMEPSFAASLFNPYRRGAAGAAAGGAGLGLAIAQRLLERMGGRIWCRSAPGRGSTFSIELPVKPAATEAATGPDHRMEALRTRIARAAPRVLIAEDTGACRHLLRLLLAPLNVRLSFAESGGQAVALAGAQRFDAILMDNRMPTMSGPEAIAEIRRLERRQGRAHTPIIGLSADGPCGARAAFEAAGADDYVAKPFTTRRLLDALAGALECGRRGDGSRIEALG